MSNKFIKFDENDLPGLNALGLEKILLEVLDDGSVKREIGFDFCGNVVHLFPGSGRFGKRGLFDCANIETSNISDEISSVEFDEIFRNGKNGGLR